MEKTEDKLTSDDEKILQDAIKELPEETLENSDEESSKSEHPDFDDYYEVTEEEPEMKLQKGQTIEQKENESEDYY